MDLYFDSSVYGFIHEAQEARAVRRWLADSGHRVRASDEANVGEALRISDIVARGERVKTILRVAPRPTYPTDLLCAEEFLGEVRRNRPEWIRTYPSLKSKEGYLRHRRALLWDWLKQDPYRLPPTAPEVFVVLHQVFGENANAQKARRRARQSKLKRKFTVHVPELAPIFASYGELEQYARYQAEVEWRFLLTEPKTASAEIDWLWPHLNGEAMSRGEDWSTFWIKEADLTAMPAIHVGTLVEYFQDQRPITVGNTVDRIHASYLVTHDRVVTADADFYDALVYVTGELKLRGSPLFIERTAGGSALAELKKAIQLDD